MTMKIRFMKYLGVLLLILWFSVSIPVIYQRNKLDNLSALVLVAVVWVVLGLIFPMRVGELTLLTSVFFDLVQITSDHGLGLDWITSLIILTANIIGGVLLYLSGIFTFLEKRRENQQQIPSVFTWL